MGIPETLKRFRTTFRLTQRQIAEKIDVPYQSYQTYEYGTATPSAKVIIKIALAFNVTSDFVLGLSDEPRPPDTTTLVTAINDAKKILCDALNEGNE